MGAMGADPPCLALPSADADLRLSQKKVKLRGTKDLSLAAVGKYGTLQEFSFFDKVKLSPPLVHPGGLSPILFLGWGGAQGPGKALGHTPQPPEPLGVGGQRVAVLAGHMECATLSPRYAVY